MERLIAKMGINLRKPIHHRLPMLTVVVLAMLAATFLLVPLSFAQEVTSPHAPTDLTATAVGTDTIELSWTAPDDGGAPITGYKIERSTDSGTTWEDAEDNTEDDDTFYSDSSARAGSAGETQYRVSAINTIGTGPVSDTASETTPVATSQPGMPTAVTSRPDGATVIELAWTAPTAIGASAITGYEIEYSKDGMLPWMDVATTTVTTDDDGTSYSDTSLAPETTRYYRVSAVNIVGRGPVSTNSAMATTTLAGVPEAPMGLTATAVGTTTIELSWTAPDAGSAPITDYKIERSVNNGAWVDPETPPNVTDDTYYSDSGADAAVETQYRVSAINTIGTGPVSDPASATTPVATAQPGAPTAVMAMVDGATVIELAWTAPTAIGASAITGYEIEYSKDGMLPWMDVATTTVTADDDGTSYSDTRLAPETTRYYRVSAVNNSGRGPVSDPAMATTTLAGVPEAPMRLTATAVGTTTIELSWTAPDAGSAPITDYKIERSVNNGAWVDAETDNVSDDTYYSDSDADAAGETQYRVSAINTIGTGPVSDTASATTPVATSQPGAPTAVTATVDGAMEIELTWTAPVSAGASAITSYKIEYSEDGMVPWMEVGTTRVTADDPGTSYSDAGLAPETTRHYRVSAVNLVGRGPVSTPPAMATTTDPTTASPPGKTTGLTATAVAARAIELSWTAPDDGGSSIMGYKIERSINDGVTWGDAEDDTQNDDTFYSDSSARVGSEGETQYRVSAINTIGTGPVSNPASATTPVATAQPGAPTEVTAMADGATVINLMWEAPGMGASAITRYEIEYSKDGMVPWMDVATTTVTADDGTSYSDTRLAPETTRHYRVSAVNIVGRGPVSTPPAMATTTLAGVPEAPMGLTATAVGTDTIELSWIAPDEGRAPITDYKIERSVNNGAWVDAETDNVSDDTYYSDSDADAAVETQYRVSAINTIGTGPVSDTASATTPVATAQPGAPTAVMAMVNGATVINLMWEAPGMGASAITGYQIEYSKDGMLPWMDVATITVTTDDDGTSYSDTGLAPETTRHYRVSAVNNSGRGPVSDPAMATTTLAGVPEAPMRLTATAVGTTTIELSWTAPDEGRAPITDYKIERSVNNGAWVDAETDNVSDDTYYSDSDADAAVETQYRVSAINTIGTGPVSDTASATTPVATAQPGAPTAVTSRPDGATEIELAWEAPGMGASAITGYEIEYSKDGELPWMDVATITVTTDDDGTRYSDTGLAPETTRYYRVSAINILGRGPVSATTTIATTDKAPVGVPGVPTGLMATANGPTEINLSWTAPAEVGNTPIMGYRIESSATGSSSWAVLTANTGMTATSYTDTSLMSGMTRHYRVAAINSAGHGTASESDSATTPVLPGAPMGLTATATGRTQIDLSWTAPGETGDANITGYQIESSADGSDGSWMDLVANTGSAATTYTDRGLDPETTKHYRVSAISSVGTGPVSNVDQATTEALMVPGAPTGLTATADGPMEINLSWSAPTETGGADIMGYRIETSTDGNDPWMMLVESNAGTSYADTNLMPGMTRHYRVAAINSVGHGTASESDSATTPVLPGAPMGLTATATGRTQIDLSWTAPGETGDANITGYQIESSADGSDGSWMDLVANTGSTATTYTDIQSGPGDHQALPGVGNQFRRYGHGVERSHGDHGSANGTGSADRLDGDGGRADGNQPVMVCAD